MIVRRVTDTAGRAALEAARRDRDAPRLFRRRAYARLSEGDRNFAVGESWKMSGLQNVRFVVGVPRSDH